MDWLDALQHLRAAGLPAVLATVSEVRGHAPREAGAKMVVGADSTWGTIGGGNLEATVVDQARDMMDRGVSLPQNAEFPLNEHAVTQHGKQCCGGKVRVLLEPFLPLPTVAIFGVGHVGYELGRILSRVPMNLYVVDSREEQLDAPRLADVTSGAADVRSVHTPVPDSFLRELPAGTHDFIMSHDHSEDFLLCDAALRRGDLGSVGLIGSRAKWLRFRQKLAAEGFSESEIDRIQCPIGLPDVPGKAPAVIAVSASAGLLPTLTSRAFFQG
ncbi:xanthine dehydrogenase accessory protein XdhC [Arthrobacter sp. B2a2-09]|uniref:xanthine dehydrogenase accessory protein XdhC n=1 Tax=Arthrobacter sp. B2a2-09 TaxID=2952822 RepID=UPI0022CDB41A|nr:xanthine dehydrogenase accessory protein XdhC [Arthrobacter sp. B2a2-09]MCZ9881698.1 xanthine dehydrogenase accessory protein XdhC [Arthrobacter sp. B2a2-09]